MRFDPSRFGIRHQLLGLFGLFLITGALVLAIEHAYLAGDFTSVPNGTTTAR